MLLLLFGTSQVFCQDAVLVLHPGPVLSVTAGSGRSGFNGEGAAARALLSAPSGLAYDAAGNLLLADTRNHRVRRISTAGAITTIAGTGVQGFSGDGGPATAAQLDSPLGVAVAADGTIYIADTRNQRVRHIGADGVISTVVGSGVAGFGGDVGSATAALLRNPAAVAVGLSGELYVADAGNQRVRRVALDGTITTVAGNGREEAIGDGGLAVQAGLDGPTGLAVRASDGALLIADRLNSRIRVVTTDGRIASLRTSTVPLRRVSGVSVDAGGNVFVADRGNFRLQALTANGSGVLLGSGEQGTPDPTVPYNATPLGAPYAVVPDGTGGVSFTDRDHAQVQHLALPELLFATTVAGQTSPVQTVALQNGGDTSLAISAVAVSGMFAVPGTGTCGAAPFTLAGRATCTVAVAFVPTSIGAQAGVLAVLAGEVPQRVLLQGTAVGAGTLLQTTTLLHSNGTLSYVGSPVTLQVQVLVGGTAIPTGSVHLLDASLELAQAILDGGGAAAFTTSVLATGQHTLTARYDGDARYAASTSAAQNQTVVPAPDFAVSVASTSLAMTAGASGQMALLLQPMNGTLNRQVTLSVDGLPAGATVTNDAPTPLVLASNAVTVNLAMKTPAVVARLHQMDGLASLAWVVVPCMGARRFRKALAMLMLGSALTLLSGCGGGYLGGAKTAAQGVAHSYPITVTASTTGVTGSPLVHTATFTLVVQ